MGDDLVVRRYEPADAERVWTVHERAFRASPLPFVPDSSADEDLAAISERYVDPGGEFLVGHADGKIVAVGGYRPQTGEAGETVEIERMRVHPEYQGRGYGRRLLSALEERARAAGFERAELETSERLRAARGLYESVGYEEIGREPHPATGDEMIRYRRPLRPVRAED